MAQKVTVNVRMYNVGELGDCFLLKFSSGSKTSNVLIDCGSFRNSEKSQTRLRTIVSHIKQELNDKPLDLIIGTHQHNDHLSGFHHCKDLFQGMTRRVWLSWLDNPRSKIAREIANEHKKLFYTLTDVASELKGMNGPDTYKAIADHIEDVIGVLPAKGTPFVPQEGLNNLKQMGLESPVYLDPGEIHSLPEMEKLVKVYVLGPPKDTKFLKDTKPGKNETYDHALALANTQAFHLKSALAVRSGRDENMQWHERHFPFTNHYKVTRQQLDERPSDPAKVADWEKLRSFVQNYEQQDTWRKIDEEWLKQAERLALYLDDYTNNSSLVLAFELVRSGKVMLFVGDAQTGNWLSWKNIKWEGMPPGFDINELLANTVVYKVGHHGSENATLVDGLEAMKHEDLVALIPVDKNDPNITKDYHPWKMPATNLYRRLKEKTKNRILRMDSGYADECDPDVTKQQWPGSVNVDPDGLYVEYEFTA